MTRALLITQCLQEDFVGRIAAHAPLPNKLHVGEAEARRLLGEDPQTGPVAQLLAWVRSLPEGAVTQLHVRDWHDPQDPRQAAHLDTFGVHCVAGSPGARLLGELDEEVERNPSASYIDAIGLNDFEGTDLEPRIRAVQAEADGPLRVAVVGVWTEAKVTFLLYDLVTRLGLTQLATCSALTASSSRAKHFAALEQLRTILGVQICDSVGELAAFLCPGTEAPSPRLPALGPGPEIRGADPDPDDRDLLAYLYRDSARLELTPLSGGFSGAAVFAVRSEDALGHLHSPSVAKLGPRGLLAKERVAFERVEPILGNDAPRVLGYVDLGDRAGLKYAFAAMGQGGVRTFKSLYEADAPVERLVHALDDVFGDVLGRFERAALYEPLPLLAHYGFSVRHAPSVARNVAAIVGPEAAARSALVRFYEDALPTLGSPPEHHFVSFVHGDLNGANILLDERDNVWLIDFFHADRAHVLKDLVKLENDLLFLFMPLAHEAALAEGKRLVDALGAVEDLAAELPESPPGVTLAPLLRAWALLRTLRGYVARYCRSDRDPSQHRVAALRYAAHTLSFDEASPLQRRLALHAAEGHARAVEEFYRAARALRVDWVEAPELAAAHGVGLTLCPGRRDRGRSLDEDLAVVHGSGARTLVSLLPASELAWAGVEALPEAARAAGLSFLELAIPDQGVVSQAEVAGLLDAIEAHRAVAPVVVHCMGGLGRSGTVAACLLIRLGATADAALAAVREARGPRCVETRAQEDFVRAFAAT
ncbi:phosphatase domain-containing protein [Enhygromyxa salina]|uniref:phosphatase domain-containing protein n=1 Tax=Enhygromyxa salina TaxID=215803 RepID=UPI0015E5C1C1|nr:phosphotransferase [Enhygromyxa salina]